MNAKIIIPITLALISSACSSSYFASSGQHDDIYYTPGKDAVKTTNSTNTSDKKSGTMSNYEKYRNSLETDGQSSGTSDTLAATAHSTHAMANDSMEREPMVESSENYNTDDGANVATNYYADDDFYYASRIRRFHSGFAVGYYDPFFVDPYFYNSGWSIGFGYGYGYGWGGYSDPWYSPYYGYGYGFGFGYGGYYNPYYGGYYGGHYGGHHRGGGFYNNYYRYGGGSMGYANRISSRAGDYRSTNMRTSYNNNASRRGDNISRSTERSVYTRGIASQNTNGRSVDRNSSRNNSTTVSENTSRTYTPSYSRPRSSSRPSYNDGSTSRSSYTTSSSGGSRSSGSSRSSSGYSQSRSSYTPSSSNSSSSRSSYSPSSSSSSRSSGSSGGGGGGGRRR